MTLQRASARAVEFVGTEPPKTIRLFPPGAEIVARDGRRWKLSNPQAVVDAFIANKAKLPIDWEHAQDLKAPLGEQAPAAGWIEAIRIDADGALVGDVEWTERGRASIASKEYRYFSPSFWVGPDGEIVKVDGGGLVNRPALELPELAREQDNPTETTMDKKLAAALGLAETDTVEKAVAAVTALKDAAEKPDLSKFAPRADLEAALARAQGAEARLSEQAAAARKSRALAAVDAAVAAGKVTPASKEYYLARAETDAELEALEKHLTSLGAVIPAKTGLEDKQAGKAAADALSEAEKDVCRRMGLSEAEFIKNRAAA